MTNYFTLEDLRNHMTANVKTTAQTLANAERFTTSRRLDNSKIYSEAHLKNQRMINGR